MSVVHVSVGAVTPTGAKVIAKTTSGGTARLAVSTSPALSSPTFFGPVASANNIVILTATGLTANTQYYYGIEDASTLDTTTTGKFKTFPTAGSQASFTFAASSCAGSSASADLTTVGVSNRAIFDTIRNTPGLLFLAHQGDRSYVNRATNDVAGFRTDYDNVMAASRQHRLYRDLPTVYAWDDHDFGNDNSATDVASRPAVSQVYRERIPSYTLPAGSSGDHPIYHSFEVGRVLFIVADTRHDKDHYLNADGPSHTLLGAAQKAWMLGVLTASTAKALVWLNGTPWMGLHPDTWNGYETERAELVDMFDSTGWLDRMVTINGDNHAHGMDTGGGNAHGGFPVWMWGSLDSTPSGVSTQYDMGPSSPGIDRWGTVQVVDSGAFIALTGTGYIGSTPWRSYTKYIVTTAGVTPPRDLSMLYDDVLSRVRVTSTESSPYVPVTDAFTRSVATGWGTAGSGQAWTTAGGAAANFSVPTDRGRVSLTPVGTRHYTYLATPLYDDVEITTSFTVPATATGGDIGAGVLIRAQGTTDHYMAQVLFKPGGVLHVDWTKRVASGSYTNLVGGVDLPDTYSGASRVNLRVRASGAVLSMKAWNNTNPEPAGWSLVATDATFTSGQIGTHTVLFAGNTNTLPVLTSYDDFQTVTPAPLHLRFERSTNEINWSTIRGGQDQPAPAGIPVTVDDYEFAADVPNFYRVSVLDDDGDPTDSVTGVTTPDLGGKVWLKSIARPYLHRSIDLAGDEPEQASPARGGVFDVVGRTYPVAVTDVRGSPRYQIVVRTETVEQAKDFRLVLAAGDPVLLQAPADHCALESAYAVLGDTSWRRQSPANTVRLFTIPVTEIAAPGPDIIGATITCAGILAAFATCQDLLDAVPTCQAVLEQVGTPADVIVS